MKDLNLVKVIVAAMVAVLVVVSFGACSDHNFEEVENGGHGGGNTPGGETGAIDTILVESSIYKDRIITRTPEARPTLIDYKDFWENRISVIFKENPNQSYDTVVNSTSEAKIMIPEIRTIFRKNLDFTLTDQVDNEINGDMSHVFSFDRTKVTIRTSAEGEYFTYQGKTVMLPKYAWKSIKYLGNEKVVTEFIKDTTVMGVVYHMNLVKLPFRGTLSDQSVEDFYGWLRVCVSDNGTTPDDEEEEISNLLEDKTRHEVSRDTNRTTNYIYSIDAWKYMIVRQMTETSTDTVWNKTLTSKLYLPTLPEKEFDDFDFVKNGEGKGTVTDNTQTIYTIVSGQRIEFKSEWERAIFSYKGLELKLEAFGRYTNVKWIGSERIEQLSDITIGSQKYNRWTIAHRFVSEYSDNKMPQEITVYQVGRWKAEAEEEDKLLQHYNTTVEIYKDANDNNWYSKFTEVFVWSKKGEERNEVKYNLGVDIKVQNIFEVIQNAKEIVKNGEPVSSNSKKSFVDDKFSGNIVSTTFTTLFDGGNWNNQLVGTYKEVIYSNGNLRVDMTAELKAWSNFVFLDYDQVADPTEETIDFVKYNKYASTLKYSVVFNGEAYNPAQSMVVKVVIPREDNTPEGTLDPEWTKRFGGISQTPDENTTPANHLVYTIGVVAKNEGEKTGIIQYIDPVINADGSISGTRIFTEVSKLPEAFTSAAFTYGNLVCGTVTYVDPANHVKGWAYSPVKGGSPIAISPFTASITRTPVVNGFTITDTKDGALVFSYMGKSVIFK